MFGFRVGRIVFVLVYGNKLFVFVVCYWFFRFILFCFGWGGVVLYFLFFSRGGFEWGSIVVRKDVISKDVVVVCWGFEGRLGFF